jgi:hypothetical protein
MKIFMDECDLEDVKYRVANDHLSSFVRKNRGRIAILALSRLNEGEKVEKVLFEAPMEICKNCSHRARIERIIMNPFRRIYLFLRGYIRKEISFSETICGVVLIITLTVLSTNETRNSF